MPLRVEDSTKSKLSINLDSKCKLIAENEPELTPFAWKWKWKGTALVEWFKFQVSLCCIPAAQAQPIGIAEVAGLG